MNPGQRVLAAAVVDTALVGVFVLIGRSSHRESLGAVEFLVTAWPFVVGLAGGWLATRAWRAPFAIGRTGLPVWGTTLVLGMLLRLASGQGVSPAFVLVAAIVLGAFLVGWRVLVEALERRSTRPPVPR
ncbi:MAG: hypothetical protein QOE37_1169 [Microbacteriaceae bacterium]|nr:hypothetical protein [Microbacteriaceae bacterium]